MIALKEVEGHLHVKAPEPVAEPDPVVGPHPVQMAKPAE